MNGTSCRLTVRFRDLDALGHANYAVYLTYMEEGFLVLWREALCRIGRQLSPSAFGCVAARAEIDYLSPAQLGEEIQIDVWVESVGSSSFTTAYDISAGGDGRKIAFGRTVQVVMLNDSRDKFMPEELKAALLALTSRRPE